MSCLIVEVGRSASNQTLEIQLDGVVPEDAVVSINSALKRLRESVLTLRRGVPELRYADGYWCTSASCPSKYRTTLVTEGLATPLCSLGYRQPVPVGGGLVGAGGTYRAPTVADEICWTVDALLKTGRTTLARDEQVGPHRPPTEPEGGEGAKLVFDASKSIEVLPATTFDLGSRTTLVIGLGWDNLRNKTYEAIYGGGAPPDVDARAYTVNRWGEVLDELSPKGARELPTTQRAQALLRSAKTATYHSAVAMSADSRSGASSSDDELVIVHLDHLDPAVCGLLITASLQSGARDLRYVTNLYGRVLEVGSSATEIELCRFRIPTEKAPPDSKTAAVFRLDRPLVAGAAWTLEAVGGFCELADPSRPFVKPGDALVGVRAGHYDIPLCKADLSLSAMIEGGVFKANLERLADAVEHCGPIALTFSTPGAGFFSTQAQKKNGDGDAETEGADDTYECVFDEDPSKHIEFEPQRLGWASLGNLLGLSSRVGVPCVASTKSRYAPRFSGDGLTPFLGVWSRSNRPDRVVLTDFSVFIPAMDTGGTTDAYMRAWYKSLNVSAGRLVKEAFEHEICRSKVRKKTKCPALIDFQDDFALCVPIEACNRKIAQLIITCRDKDWGVGAIVDDTVFRHQIDLSDFRAGDTDQFLVKPDWVDDVNDIRANHGFTKDMVVLKYKATLLYPGDPQPAGVTGVLDHDTVAKHTNSSSSSHTSQSAKSSSPDNKPHSSMFGFSKKR